MKRGLQALFVHGMGRSPLSGWPLLSRLRRAGVDAGSFGYSAAVEDVERIGARLMARLLRLADAGDYVLIGHSLGGVLLRRAVNAMPGGTRLPRHVFLLGSPQQPSRLAQSFGSHWGFRLLTRDCGRLLGSAQRMAAVGALTVPTTNVVGTISLPWLRQRFGDEPNDGVVALSEVSAPWIEDQVLVKAAHTWLPASRQVSRVVLDRLQVGIEGSTG